MTIPRLRGAFAPGTQPAAQNELLVLLPSLGTTMALWDGTVEALRASTPGSTLRILRVDLPGHGSSPAVAEPFTIAELADAVLGVVEEAGGGAFHLAGLSLGGAIALELALAHPERVKSLALFCTDSKIGTTEGWEQRAAAVRASGTASLVTGSAERWFAPGFLEQHPLSPAARSLSTLIDIDDESYARCNEALAAFDRTASLGSLRAPVLVVSGEHDAVTTPEAMQTLTERIPNGYHSTIAGTAHLAALEDPDAAARLLTTHLRASATPARPGATSAHEQGMRVRREVLGDAHVDRAVAGTTAETAPFQDFITRYAWGEIWARDELSRRERSVATLASLVTGSHEAEIRMHVRAALTNGLTRAEIAEVILHTALYAGLPPANAALGIAKEVFAGLDAAGAAGTADAADTAESPESSPNEGAERG
ncbi:4-carboxymuconolactone decarboxylase [Pseudoclavibacter sp. RFBG4]|uniref:bifunctional 3-oxoadipate enol-lactonase/4-carboxymuconolactone decarboxylase PcaDC n=1 Tax=Pseudoclavibacter sp. RFBG4 TaxID=2080575 RepID=UPI000CE830BA|nr:4-carboxymuconolactone decarboxylase [Pseudoclavibacter sp. RFBG4]PPG26709.1 4-carboxymuconolactone decarboxylase [Pseudoclavibacter sp. RFBG4]